MRFPLQECENVLGKVPAYWPSGRWGAAVFGSRWLYVPAFAVFLELDDFEEEQLIYVEEE